MQTNASFQTAAGGCPQGCAGCGLIAGLLLLGAGTVAISSLPPLGIFLFIAGGIVLSLGLYGWLARQQAETVDVTVRVRPEPLRLGDQVQVEAIIVAKRDVRLGEGLLTLRCREVAISRGGTSDTTYTHTVYEDSRPLSGAGDLGPGSSWTGGATFLVPTELPASFAGRNNSIEWHIVLHVPIPGPRLDIRRDNLVLVRPEIV